MKNTLNAVKRSSFVFLGGGTVYSRFSLTQTCLSGSLCVKYVETKLWNAFEREWSCFIAVHVRKVPISGGGAEPSVSLTESSGFRLPPEIFAALSSPRSKCIVRRIRKTLDVAYFEAILQRKMTNKLQSARIWSLFSIFEARSKSTSLKVVRTY